MNIGNNDCRHFHIDVLRLTPDADLGKTLHYKLEVSLYDESNCSNKSGKEKANGFYYELGCVPVNCTDDRWHPSFYEPEYCTIVDNFNINGSTTTITKEQKQ